MQLLYFMFATYHMVLKYFPVWPLHKYILMLKYFSLACKLNSANLKHSWLSKRRDTSSEITGAIPQLKLCSVHSTYTLCTAWNTGLIHSCEHVDRPLYVAKNNPINPESPKYFLHMQKYPLQTICTVFTCFNVKIFPDWCLPSRGTKTKATHA